MVASGGKIGPSRGSACDYPSATPRFLPHSSQPGDGGCHRGGIGNPLEGGAARVRLGSTRLASLERPIPLGPRADARVWTPCLSVIGSRPFDRSEVECHNEVPTMTSAGPDGSRTPPFELRKCGSRQFVYRTSGEREHRAHAPRGRLQSRSPRWCCGSVDSGSWEAGSG